MGSLADIIISSPVAHVLPLGTPATPISYFPLPFLLILSLTIIPHLHLFSQAFHTPYFHLPYSPQLYKKPSPPHQLKTHYQQWPP